MPGGSSRQLARRPRLACQTWRRSRVKFSIEVSPQGVELGESFTGWRIHRPKRPRMQQWALRRAVCSASCSGQGGVDIGSLDRQRLFGQQSPPGALYVLQHAVRPVRRRLVRARRRRSRTVEAVPGMRPLPLRPSGVRRAALLEGSSRGVPGAGLPPALPVLPLKSPRTGLRGVAKRRSFPRSPGPRSDAKRRARTTRRRVDATHSEALRASSRTSTSGSRRCRRP